MALESTGKEILCKIKVNAYKSFDNVKWEKLFCIMDQIGIDFKLKKLICKLYINKKVVITGENNTYEEAKI